MSEPIVVFHHNDMDGYAAAAIIYWKLGEHRQVELHEISYGWPIPWEAMRKDDTVYIVDFSFTPDDTRRLLTITEDVHWIDHHKTAIEALHDFDLKGLRSIEHAGCYLTWQYLFPDKDVPRAIRLVSDRDTWQWKYGQETARFHAGLQTRPHSPDTRVWRNLLHDNRLLYADLMREILRDGTVVLDFQHMFCEDYLRSYGYEAQFGEWTILALNLRNLGSQIFGSLIDDYPFVASYAHDGNRFIVSLYLASMDVSVIAQQFGGGGHRNASGFECVTLPWTMSTSIHSGIHAK